MLLPVLLACANEEPAPAAPAAAPPLRALKVGLNWFPEPEFGGFYEALRSGGYREQGLEVELVPGGPRVPVLEMLASGQLDVAISGADDLLIRRARGLDAVAVYAGFQNSPVGLLVHDPGPASYAAITGPVAMEPGSPFQQFLFATMQWEGKVELVPTSGGLGAFSTNDALAQQAYVTSEPCVAEAKGIATRFLPAADVGWNPYASLAVVRGADANEPWVSGFVVASLAGWNAYLADPGKANLEIAKLNPEMTVDRMRCISERQLPFVRGSDGVGALSQARMDEMAVALRGVGQEAKAEGSVKNMPGVPTAAAPVP